MSMLEGRTAIVTAATSGVGADVAKLLAKEGAKVVVCGTNEDECQAVVDDIMAGNGHAMFHFLDLADQGSLDAAIADTRLEWGHVDIMVNGVVGAELAS